MNPMQSSLFGISVGEKVQYIANNKDDFSSDINNAKGVVKKINFSTGEFYVRLDGHSFSYCFMRYELFKIGQSLENNIFKGNILNEKSMTIGEMRNYLTTYHSFTEGRNFSIMDSNGVKEVFLLEESYFELIENLSTSQLVADKLDNKISANIINSRLRSEIINGECISFYFKLSNWVFRTHITHSILRGSVLTYYGVDENDRVQ